MQHAFSFGGGQKEPQVNYRPGLAKNRENKLTTKKNICDALPYNPSPISSANKHLIRNSDSGISVGLFLNETPQNQQRFNQMPTD